MRMPWKLLNVLTGALFLFAAALQFNDPQPVRWVVLYLAAASTCFWAATAPLPRLIPVALAAVALLWAGAYILGGIGIQPFGRMFHTWTMYDQQVVEAREVVGLVVVASWMLLQASGRSWRRQSAPA